MVFLHNKEKKKPRKGSQLNQSGLGSPIFEQSLVREGSFRVVFLSFHFELDGPYPRGTELRVPRVKPVERQVEARRDNDVQIFLVRCVKGRKTHRSSYLLVSGEMSPRIACFALVSYVG